MASPALPLTLKIQLPCEVWMSKNMMAPAYPDYLEAKGFNQPRHV